MIFCNNIGTVNKIKQKLAKKFEMKDMGNVANVLGMNVTRDSKSIKIDQTKYIEDVLARFGMSDCNPTSSPIDCNQKI